MAQRFLRYRYPFSVRMAAQIQLSKSASWNDSGTSRGAPEKWDSRRLVWGGGGQISENKEDLVKDA